MRLNYPEQIEVNIVQSTPLSLNVEESQVFDENSILPTSNNVQSTPLSLRTLSLNDDEEVQRVPISISNNTSMNDTPISNDKPRFKCDYCESDFSCKNSTTRHEIKEHTW